MYICIYLVFYGSVFSEPSEMNVSQHQYILHQSK